MREILTGEKLILRIEWTSRIILVFFTVGAWIVFSGRMALGVLLGGIISSLSFQILKWQLQRAFGTPGRVSKGKLFFGYYLRYLGTLFVVFVVMYYGWADPIAFLVGLSVVIGSILVVGGQEFFLLLKKGED